MKSCDTGTATKWRYDAIDFLISERYSTFKARASFSISIKLLNVSRYDFIFIGDMSNFWGAEKKYYLKFRFQYMYYSFEFALFFNKCKEKEVSAELKGSEFVT